jgi:hypothetical protein
MRSVVESIKSSYSQDESTFRAMTVEKYEENKGNMLRDQ